MPIAPINGVNIYYEESGEGFPLVWSHEFAGDHRSWAEQVGFFESRYRVVTYAARGYPPSGIPRNAEAYTLENAVEDLRALLDHLKIDRAHIGGLSMGGSVALNFGLTHPDRARSLIVAGTGTGCTDPDVFRAAVRRYADLLEAKGMSAMREYARSDTRAQLLRKDAGAWKRFFDGFMEHSAAGSALTFRGVQGGRKPIFELEAGLRALEVPTLIMLGDEDGPCVEPGLFMKSCIRRSGLVTFPQSGHAINLEEPDLFNRTVSDFLSAVESGKWAERDAEADTAF
jgi:pimeloyl-ACP methyl ester carboxylesterase